MATITDVLSQHPILASLAPFLSTLDFYHLGLTSRTHYAYILSSRRVFDVLRRQCLCDGGGLRKRQDFAGLYSLKGRSYVWGRLVLPLGDNLSFTLVEIFVVAAVSVGRYK
jgi:hypothetical protein